MAAWGGLTNSCEKKRSGKQRRKGKIYPFECMYTHTHIYTYACMLSRFSRVWLFTTLWTIVCQVPLSLGFSRQEYWSECSVTTWSWGMGREMGGMFKREGKYVYLWLIHVDVRQKPRKFCKAITLQLKKKKINLTKKRILEWVAMPSSKGSSLSRDQTHVSFVSCNGRWVLSH